MPVYEQKTLISAEQNFLLPPRSHGQPPPSSGFEIACRFRRPLLEREWGIFEAPGHEYSCGSPQDLARPNSPRKLLSFVPAPRNKGPLPLHFSGSRERLALKSRQTSRRELQSIGEFEFQNGLVPNGRMVYETGNNRTKIPICHLFKCPNHTSSASWASSIRKAKSWR